LETFQLSPHTSDRFIWKWTASGTYNASSAYRAFFIGMTSLPGAKFVWRAAVPPKVKFFFWLALHGRLWTADHRKRHGLQPEATCALCDQDGETTDHLLASCPFTREVWARLLASAGHQYLAPGNNSTLADWWLLTLDEVPGTFRRAFDTRPPSRLDHLERTEQQDLYQRCHDDDTGARRGHRRAGRLHRRRVQASGVVLHGWRLQRAPTSFGRNICL